MKLSFDYVKQRAVLLERRRHHIEMTRIYEDGLKILPNISRASSELLDDEIAREVAKHIADEALLQEWSETKPAGLREKLRQLEKC